MWCSQCSRPDTSPAASPKALVNCAAACSQPGSMAIVVAATTGFGVLCAGLVYKHYGKEIIASYMKLPVEHPDVQAVHLQVYKNFIEAVDAVDNGVNQFDTDSPPK